MDYVALKAELDAGHPDTGPYNADDALAVDELNLANRSRNRTSMTGAEVIDAFSSNKAEWDALTAEEQDRIITLCGRDSLNPFGIDADIFLDAAQGATATISALQAARTETVSRAVELGLGTIKIGDVQNARALP